MKPRHLCGNNGQGMNWIRKEKRLAIYLRDGLMCVYCSNGIEDDVKLTLDHIIPRSKKGSNHESNLITACHVCNSSRGARSLSTFVRAVARYKATKVQKILERVQRQTRLHLAFYTQEAEWMMKRRGGFTNVMNGGRR